MMPVNTHTLSRYAAHINLQRNIKSKNVPAISVTMILSELCVRSTLAAYNEQGWSIIERHSGMVFRKFVARHVSGTELEITPRDYIGRYNRLLPM